jgi:hypothetical protein
MGQLCGTAGCGVFAYAVAPTGLYDVQLPSGVTALIAPTLLGDSGFPIGLSDVALDPSGTLYGVAGNVLYRVDRLSGNVSPLHVVQGTMNSLDVLPGGELYGAGQRSIWSVNRATGALLMVGSLAFNNFASGDLAVVSGRIYLTVGGAGLSTDGLFEIFPDGGVPRLIGETGNGCVWGLAAYGPLLYGFSCLGQVLRIDVATGAATLLSTSGPDFYGASAR